MIRVYTGDTVDGVSLGKGASDPICLYNSAPAVPQWSNGLDGPAVPTTGAQVVTYQQNLTVASIAANTAAEQALTVGTTAGNGPLTTDFVAAINKPTSQAGMGINGARISAANTLQFVLSNATTAAVTPTANQVYNVAILRNMPVHSQVLTPTAIPASAVAGIGTTSEQIFNLTPVAATGTVNVNAAGQVVSVTMTGAGSNYTIAPTLLFADTTFAGAVNIAGSNQQYAPSLSGVALTNSNLVGNNNVNIGPGKGAAGLPIMSSTGTVLGVQIINPGSGYTPGSTIVAFKGGNAISVGMAIAVTKPTTNAGVAVTNARVVANNQIAIQYTNFTSAAVTPTSEAYTSVGLNTLPPCNHVASYGVVGTGLVSVASITSSEQSVTVNGILATDIIVGMSKPTLTVGLLNGTGRVSAANTIQVPFINATQTAATPSATEIYGVTVLSQTPLTPFTVLNYTLTPVSVAANTSAEQTFTVTPLPFINSSPSTVFVNKPSLTPGLAVAGCRVSAANTLAINYINVTATAITPVAETYTIGVFNAVGPGGGVPGSWVALCARTGDGQTLNLVNEFQLALSESGIGAINGYAGQ